MRTFTNLIEALGTADQLLQQHAARIDPLLYPSSGVGLGRRSTMLVALCRAGHVSGTGVAEVHAMTGRLVHRWSAREPVSALAETLLPDVFLLDQRSIQERDVFVLGPRIDEAGFAVNASFKIQGFQQTGREVWSEDDCRLGTRLVQSFLRRP